MIRIFVPRMNSSQARVLKEKYLGEKLRNIRELQGFLLRFLVIGFLINLSKRSYCVTFLENKFILSGKT